MTDEEQAAQVATEAAAKAAAEKATADQAAAAKAEAETKAAAEKAKLYPDKYDLTLPDGSLVDAAGVERIAAYAKAQGLSQPQAQALLERESGNAAAVKEGQAAQLEQAKKVWLAAASTDKEFGGDSFPKNAELSKRVIARYGSDALKAALDETGLGNHPELVRMLVRIGKAMSEDQLVIAGQAAGGEVKDAATVLYGPEGAQPNKE